MAANTDILVSILWRSILLVIITNNMYRD